MTQASGRASLDRKLRILLVQRQAGGGSIVSLVELAKALTRQSVEPTVLMLSGSAYEEQLRDSGIEVISVGGGSEPPSAPAVVRKASRLKSIPVIADFNRLLRSDVKRAGGIARLIGEGGYDLVHHNVGLRVDRASIIAAAQLRLPQVVHIRAFEPYGQPLDSWIARIPNRFIYISEAVREHCERHLKASRPKGSVIYNAVDVPFYVSGRARREEIRSSLGVDGSARVILSVGRVVRWKGQATLIAAAAPLLRERSDVSIVIAGSPGHDADGQQYQAELTAIIRETGLEDRIRMVGFVKDVPGLLAAADVVVHTAVQPEPFGRVIAESMAAERPVIGTAAGGVVEIITHEDNGLLVPPADPEALRAALARLLDDPGLVRRLVGGGRRHVAERFSTDRLGREVAALYRDLLGRARNGNSDATGRTPGSDSAYRA